MDSTAIQEVCRRKTYEASQGIVLSLGGDGAAIPAQAEMPMLPSFLERDFSRADYGTRDLRLGLTIDMWVEFSSLKAGQVLIDSRIERDSEVGDAIKHPDYGVIGTRANERGQGLALITTDNKTVEIILNDGRTENRWNCDPGILTEGKLHHIAVVVDCGPKIITFIIDGKLNDGGKYRQFGWGRFNRDLRHVNGDRVVRIGKGEGIMPKLLRIYNRALTTSELSGNYKAGQ